MNAYAKAVIAALVAGLGALQLALDDNVITGTEWVKVAVAVLAAAGLVWGVPNTAQTDAVPHASAPDDGGEVVPDAPAGDDLIHSTTAQEG